VSGEKLVQYTQCGLDDVWLANGYRVEETEYGRGLAIDHATELHHVIARAIINNPRPVRGKHARFLRVILELSQANLGKLLGVDRATVIRWEKARDKPLTLMADIAIRETYAARVVGGSLIASVIKELQEADEAQQGADYRAVFKTENSGWQESLAA
jgi:putative transcriptional regulator